MSAISDALRALRDVLSLQDEVRRLKQASTEQAERLARLAEAHVMLRERVVAIETFLRTAGGQPFAPPSQPRIGP